MIDRSYVQASVEQLEILPLLRRKSYAVVFKCIELFEADPLGASKRDILDYTGLSRPSVEEALRALELHGLAHFTPETRRYRLDPKYVCFRGEPQCIRELVPILQGEPRNPKGFAEPAKKLLTEHVCMSSHSPSPGKEEHTNMAARKIFAAAHVQGPNLDRLAAAVAPDLAQAWAEWVEDAPTSFTDPVAFMVKRLRADPCATPPPARQRRLPGCGEYGKFVHFSKEHMQFLRDHPERRSECECWREEAKG